MGKIERAFAARHLAILLALFLCAQALPDCAQTYATLSLPSKTIRKHAPGFIELVRQLIFQPLREYAYKRQGLDFRKVDPAAVQLAYDKMGKKRFANINGVQNWVNWWLIPKTLRGTVPSRPVSVIDLGCGPGSSTHVLARFLHPRSSILGIDLAPALVEQAKREVYRYQDGSRVHPHFSVGSATQTFHDENGAVIQANSIDYVNSSGVVGHHLDAKGMDQLAIELERVIKPGGHAALDNGPKLTETDIVPIMQSHGFTLMKRVTLIRGDPRGQLLFLKN